MVDRKEYYRIHNQLSEIKERRREYYLKHEQEIKEYQRKYQKEYQKKYNQQHKKKVADRRKAYMKKHPEQRKKVVERAKKNQHNVRDKFFSMYGSKCNCPGCIETNRGFLTLDHVQNDGNMKRAEHGGNNLGEYRKAITSYDPDIYQILCYNCNLGKHRNGGICPHTISAK